MSKLVSNQKPEVPQYTTTALQRERELWVPKLGYIPEACRATDAAIASDIATETRYNFPSVLCIDEAAVLIHAAEILEAMQSSFEAPIFAGLGRNIRKTVSRLGIASRLSPSLA